jgi:hypothetical protein
MRLVLSRARTGYAVLLSRRVSDPCEWTMAIGQLGLRFKWRYHRQGEPGPRGTSSCSGLEKLANFGVAIGVAVHRARHCIGSSRATLTCDRVEPTQVGEAREIAAVEQSMSPCSMANAAK